MNHHRNAYAVFAVAGALGSTGICGQARGQTVGPEYLVSATVPGHESDKNLECAVAAVRNSGTGLDEVAVGWNMRPSGTSGTLFYRISLKNSLGFLSAPLPAPLPVPCAPEIVTSFDPTAAASQTTRDIWLGGIASSTGRPFVVKKAYGSGTLGAPIDILACSGSPTADKPFTAVGPIPGATDGTETMYMPFSRTFTPTSVSCPRSANTPLVGANWVSPIPPVTSNMGAQDAGKGLSMVVMPRVTGVSNVGRIVAAFTRGVYFTPPIWTRSNFGGLGGTWENGLPLNQYTLPTPGGFIDDINPSYFPSNIYITSWPSVAVDPTDPHKVYIVFAGHAQGAPAGDSDLFVAVSTNEGNSFPAVYRLTSGQLSMPSDTPGFTPMELMPSAVVGRDHSINITFVRTAAPTMADVAATVVVRYARFSSDAALGGTPYLFQLAEPFTPTGFAEGSGGNDFHMIASTGCTLYAVYAPRSRVGAT